MKVIDLLNKIAKTKDYKDIPKKVKITTGTLKEEYRIWVWDGAWYIYEEDGMDVCICTEKLDLNDEVEIIEDKKIKKLEYWVDVKSWAKGNDLEKGLEVQSGFNKNIYYKINEIIEVLNERDIQRH